MTAEFLLQTLPFQASIPHIQENGRFGRYGIPKQNEVPFRAALYHPCQSQYAFCAWLAQDIGRLTHIEHKKDFLEHKMEILGEFDNESPLYVSFCKRISPEDFERQSLIYTQKSLEELYTQMELNPSICERLVQKRKQLGNEEGGLASYLKAKFFSMFNHGSSFKEEEIREEVEHLKCEMRRANSYALAAKTASQWPLERRARENVLLERFSPSQPNLLDSAVPAMPKIFGPYPMPDSYQKPH